MQAHRIVFGAGALALAAGSAVLALRFPRDQVMNVGPSFFPLCVALALALLGLAECVAGWRTPAVQAEPGEPARPDPAPRGLWPAAMLLAALVAWAAALPHVGFVAATVPLVMCTTWLFGGRHPLLLAANAAGIAGVTWLVFQRLLGVGLPGWGA